MKAELYPPSPRRGLAYAVLSTLVFIAAFAWLDRTIYKEVTMAPLFGAILLLVLSLTFRPGTVFLCFLFTLPYVMVSLLFAWSQDHSQAQFLVRFWIRTLTFVIIGSIAVITSFFRCRLQDMLEQTKQLLAKLPVAVLLSNSGGRIIWCNPMANKYLGNEALTGRFLLESLPSDGTPVDYNMLFSSPGSDQFVRMTLPNHAIHFVRLLVGRKSVLATVMLPQEIE